MTSPTQRDGAAAERRAEAMLAGQGLRTLARNVRCRVGELDLVMRDGATVVFVEVRRRSHAGWGGAAASVDAAKRRRLVLAAQWWLQGRCGDRAWPPCRFDVVAIDGERMRWLRDAFSAN